MDLIRDILAGLDAPERQRRLAGPVGWLASVDGDTGTHVAGGDTGAHARYRLFEAVADLLADAAALDGALVVIDDVQWAPATTLAFLRHFLVGHPQAPITVLVTARSGASLRDEQRRPFADLCGLPGALRIELAGLDAAAVGVLVQGLTGSDVTPATAERLRQTTGGNPLFVRELAQHSMQSGTALDGEALGAGRTGSVASAIDARLEDIDPAVVGLLEVASVSGRSFDRRVVVAAAVALAAGRVDPLAVPATLDDAVRSGLVAADATAPDRYIFSHDLLRQALYRRLPPEMRPRLHLEIGRATERLTDFEDRRDDDVAYHFQRAWPACSASESCRHLERAGRHAAQQLDFHQARRFFEAGVELLIGEADESNRHEELALRTLAGRAYAYAGDATAARRTLVRTYAAAREHSALSHAADAAVCFADTVRSDAGVEVQAACAAMLDDVVANGEAIEPHLHARALVQLHRSDQHLAQRQAARTLSRARAAGDHERLIAVLLDEWWNHAGDDQLALADELVALGQAIGDARTEAFGRLRRWITLIHMARAGYDDPVVATIAELVDSSRAPDLRWAWTAWRANMATAGGRLHDAKRLATQTLEIPGLADRAQSIAPARALVAYQTQMAYLCRVLGEAPPPSSHRLSQPWMWRSIDVRQFGATDAAPGDPRAAVAVMVRALEAHSGPITLDWLLHASSVGYLASLVGDRPAMDMARDRLLPLRGRFIVNVGLCIGPVDQQLGWLALHLGDVDAAAGHFADGVEINRALGCGDHETRARYNLARALWARNQPADRDRAAELAADALGGPMAVGLADLTAAPWPPT